MNEALKLYFDAFRHYAHPRQERKITFYELLGISWALHLIYAFYSIFALYLGIKSFEYFSESKDFTHLAFRSFNLQFQKFSLLTTLFSVIFYPFLFQFGYRFWKTLFKFYSQLFGHEFENQDDRSEDLLASAFSSNLFLLFPIIGNALSNLAQGFFIYKGLKKHYSFTNLQAFLVLLTPLFLIFLFVVFSASYFAFLFTLI